MRKDAPLTEAEREWVAAAAPEVSTENVPDEILKQLYPDLIHYGPNYKQILAFSGALGRELEHASKGNRKETIWPGNLPIYDQLAEWIKNGHDRDEMSFYDFDELMHKVVTSGKLIAKSGLIDMANVPNMVQRNRLHDLYHDLALDVVSDADAKVYIFDAPHSTFRYQANEVILVAFWALTGPGIFPDDHPLEAQRIKWEKAILELVPEVADV